MGVAAKGHALPPGLKVLTGRGPAPDGTPRDMAGNPINVGPDFPTAAPEKPATLSDDAAALWDEIVPGLAQVDILKPIDQAALSALCEAWSRFVGAVRQRVENGSYLTKEDGLQVRAPWVITEEAASKEIRAWCAEFGLTPAAVSKVGGRSAGAEDGNPFE